MSVYLGAHCGALLLQRGCGVWFCGLRCGAGSGTDEVRSMVPQHRSGNHTTVETHTSHRCTSSSATHTPPPHALHRTNDGQTLACLHRWLCIFTQKELSVPLSHSFSSATSPSPQYFSFLVPYLHQFSPPRLLVLPFSCVVGGIMDVLW